MIRFALLAACLLVVPRTAQAQNMKDAQNAINTATAGVNLANKNIDSAGKLNISYAASQASYAKWYANVVGQMGEADIAAYTIYLASANKYQAACCTTDWTAMGNTNIDANGELGAATAAFNLGQWANCVADCDNCNTECTAFTSAYDAWDGDVEAWSNAIQGMAAILSFYPE